MGDRSSQGDPVPKSRLKASYCLHPLGQDRVQPLEKELPTLLCSASVASGECFHSACLAVDQDDDDLRQVVNPATLP